MSNCVSVDLAVVVVVFVVLPFAGGHARLFEAHLVAAGVQLRLQLVDAGFELEVAGHELNVAGFELNVAGFELLDFRFQLLVAPLKVRHGVVELLPLPAPQSLRVNGLDLDLRLLELVGAELLAHALRLLHVLGRLQQQVFLQAG